MVSIQAQKPLCLYANNCFLWVSFGKQCFSNIFLLSFKYLKIFEDKTKNPPLINSKGFSLIFLILIFYQLLVFPLGFLYFTAVKVAVFLFFI